MPAPGSCGHGIPFENCQNCRAKTAAIMGSIVPLHDVPERRPWPSEAERAATAAAMSAHLPKPDAFKVIHFTEEDIEAIRAAFRKRFNEDVPRTETLMSVASIGYRMAMRDMAEK